MGFRNYDPGLNQFTSQDMYDGATQNMGLTTDPFTGGAYAFGGGNPISNIEQDGHTHCDAGYCPTAAQSEQVAASPSNTAEGGCPASQPGCPGYVPASEATSAGGGVICGSTASHFAGGPCTISQPGPTAPGGNLDFLTGLGSDLVGLAQSAICPPGVGALECQLYHDNGGTLPDTAYTNAIHRQGLGTGPHTTYQGGKLASDLLLLAGGGAAGAADIAGAEGATAAGGTQAPLPRDHPRASRGQII
jgi:hypothetical protein